VRNVTVLVEPLAREKILAFAEAVETEIGGLMAVRQDGHTLTITDAWTIPQTVTAGSVDFEVGHFEDHMKAMGWLNGKPMPHICMGTWHSHGNTGVFWSAIDEKDLSCKYAMRGFLVNIVVNRKGEWLCQVDSMVGPENGKPNDYILVTVPSTLKLITLREPAILAQVAAEIEANIREQKVYVTKGRVIRGFDGTWPQDDDFFSGWEGHNPKRYPLDRKPKNSKLFANARERDPLLGGVWSINKRTNCMEKWQNGKIVASISKMGDGALTLYDEDGNTLFTDKHYGSKGFLPPAKG